MLRLQGAAAFGLPGDGRRAGFRLGLGATLGLAGLSGVPGGLGDRVGGLTFGGLGAGDGSVSLRLSRRAARWAALRAWFRSASAGLGAGDGGGHRGLGLGDAG
ncbi:hypothetical protein AWW66_22240 [Micromonospora rosaria]|uniref:Uncharacterized protein n=1 Tax=Micromonospora rosaria TaxID=47874 RepID=A0A136PN51_9ACTN|nr:hypothetical protein AWW66_22240 [Micromonospora rosaria]